VILCCLYDVINNDDDDDDFRVSQRGKKNIGTAFGTKWCTQTSQNKQKKTQEETYHIIEIGARTQALNRIQ